MVIPEKLIGTPFERLPWQPIAETPQESFCAPVLFADGTIGYGEHGEYYLWHWRVVTDMGDPDPSVRSFKSPPKGDKMAYARLP